VSPDGTHTPLESFSTLDPGLYERRTVSLFPGRYQLWVLPRVARGRTA
jgi:hypothetical protein